MLFHMFRIHISNELKMNYTWTTFMKLQFYIVQRSENFRMRDGEGSVMRGFIGDKTEDRFV